MGTLQAVTSRLSRVLAWFHQRTVAVGPQARWRRVVPVALLGMLIAGLALADRTGLLSEFDPTAPFAVGQTWGLAEAIAAHGGSVTVTGGPLGYDGQWFLGLAYDPFLRGDITATFDAPQYRAQRPLLGLLGWLFAAGQPAAVPYGLLVAQLLAVGLGCAAVARIATGLGRSRWWGLAFAVIPGVLVGVLFGTAEPLGCALVALGLSLALERRYLWAGVSFAGAGLTKETYLAFAAVAAVYLAVDATLRRERWWRAAAALVLPGVLAFFAWWLYVSVAMPPTVRAPGNVFALPLVGWVEALVEIGRGDYRVDYVDYRTGPLGAIIVIGSFLGILAAIGLALRYRRSMFSYAALLWGAHGLAISGFLLGRFLSAQRALAPTILAVLLLLLAAPWSRQERSSAAPRPPLPPQRQPASQPPIRVAADVSVAGGAAPSAR